MPSLGALREGKGLVLAPNLISGDTSSELPRRKLSGGWLNGISLELCADCVGASLCNPGPGHAYLGRSQFIEWHTSRMWNGQVCSRIHILIVVHFAVSEILVLTMGIYCFFARRRNAILSQTPWVCGPCAKTPR